MSVLAASEPAVDEKSPQASLQPAWLRPLLTIFVVTVHVAALGGFAWFNAEKITPLKEITVEVLPQGETVTETSTVPTPESAPHIAPTPAVLASPDPQMRDDPDVSEPAAPPMPTLPVTAIALPPPKVEAPDAPPLPVEHPQPPKVEKVEQQLEQQRQEEQRKKAKEAKRRAALRALKRAKAEAHARQQARLAQLGAAARRAGVRDGRGEARQMSNAAYAALVSAEIARHKHYPASAREAGATGTVFVVFSVSASGSISSYRITRSSGNGALDAEVRQMMAASHPPPPPGGHFHGSIPISFNIGR